MNELRQNLMKLNVENRTLNLERDRKSSAMDSFSIISESDAAKAEIFILQEQFAASQAGTL